MVAITALIQNDAPCVAASMRRYRVAQLQHQLRLPRAEVESLIRFVRSQLEVSLGQALKKTSD